MELVYQVIAIGVIILLIVILVVCGYFLFKKRWLKGAISFVLIVFLGFLFNFISEKYWSLYTQGEMTNIFQSMVGSKISKNHYVGLCLYLNISNFTLPNVDQVMNIHVISRTKAETKKHFLENLSHSEWMFRKEIEICEQAYDEKNGIFTEKDKNILIKKLFNK